MSKAETLFKQDGSNQYDFTAECEDSLFDLGHLDHGPAFCYPRKGCGEENIYAVAWSRYQAATETPNARLFTILGRMPDQADATWLATIFTWLATNAGQAMLHESRRSGGSCVGAWAMENVGRHSSTIMSHLIGRMNMPPERLDARRMRAATLMMDWLDNSQAGPLLLDYTRIRRGRYKTITQHRRFKLLARPEPHKPLAADAGRRQPAERGCEELVNGLF